MRLPKRGQKGFTLIELLIVVAILGVLAAVVIPNVARFMGRGETEARTVEYNTVRTAIVAMMVENGIAEIPHPINYAGGAATNDMTAFPDSTSGDWLATPVLGKKTDPDGTDYAAGDGPGYLLYGHDITGGGTAPATGTVNTVSTNPMTYYYTCETNGDIRQFDNATDLTAAHEFTY